MSQVLKWYVQVRCALPRVNSMDLFFFPMLYCVLEDQICNICICRCGCSFMLDDTWKFSTCVSTWASFGQDCVIQPWTCIFILMAAGLSHEPSRNGKVVMFVEEHQDLIERRLKWSQRPELRPHNKIAEMYCQVWWHRASLNHSHGKIQ